MRRLCLALVSFFTLACGSDLPGIWAGSCDNTAAPFNLDIDELTFREEGVVQGGSGQLDVYTGTGWLQGHTYSEAAAIELIHCSDAAGCSTDRPWETDEILVTWTLERGTMLTGQLTLEPGGKEMNGTCYWDDGVVSVGAMTLVRARKVPQDLRQ